MVIRPIMLYDNKCWVLKGQQEQKIGVTKINILIWMIGYTRKNKLWNNYIWKKVWVVPIKREDNKS